MKDVEENDSSLFSKQTVTSTLYNGFKSAQYEKVYNTASVKLVQLLQEKCMELISLKPLSAPVTSRENFAIKVIKLEHVLKKLE